MPVKIPLPDEDSLSTEIKDALASLPPFNLFRMVANAPASFKGFLELTGSILVSSEFNTRLREYAVLGMAHVNNCDYVWTQHLNAAKRWGITDGEISVIADEETVSSLDDEANLLCRAADEISTDISLSDDVLALLIEQYGHRQATELILCISYTQRINICIYNYLNSLIIQYIYKKFSTIL